MKKLRLAAAATTLALVAAFVTMGSASAATPGVGTTDTATSLLDVSLGTAGSILRLRLLGDDAKATIDPAVGTSSAYSSMFALKLTSSILPAPLNNLTVGASESRTPGGNGNVTGAGINLGSLTSLVPVGSLPLATSVVSGNLAPFSLTSAVDDATGAKSGLNANLADLGIVGGLITAEAIGSNMSASAAGVEAKGSRTIDVDGVSVLNLGALLNGLGLDLLDLPIATVSGIIDSLNVPVAGLPVSTSLEDFVASLNGVLSGVGSSSGTVGGLAGPVQSTIDGALGGLGLPIVDSATGTVIDTTTVTDLLDTVDGLLSTVLETAVNVLDDISLLKLNGLHVGTITKAVNGTSGSQSEVVGTLGGIEVGGIALPGLDLSSTLGAVTGVVNGITNALNGVLGSVSPDLRGLIDLKFFDKPSTNGVSADGSYTKALAGITGLKLGINPPANLAGIISGLTSSGATSGIGVGILDAGGTLPVLGGLMGTLNNAVPATAALSALAGGATIKVADVTTGSNFAAPGSNPVGTAVSAPSLPRTGMNNAALMILGMLFAGLAITARRWHLKTVSAE